RVKKIAYREGSESDYSLTLYLGDYIVEPDGKKVKYIGGYAKKEKDRSGQERAFYFHNDHLGSTSLVTKADGAIGEMAVYRPYGEVFRNEPSLDERYKFTGQELDSETGLYYYGARYYDAGLGKFITPDRTDAVSIFNPQTLNRYAYVG